jgi:hypothetical protein
VANVTTPLPDGAKLQITGARLAGRVQGSGGNGAQDSAANVPLVLLESLVNGQRRWLRPGVGWTDGTFASQPQTGFPTGHALVTVFNNGIPSQSRVTLIPAR